MKQSLDKLQKKHVTESCAAPSDFFIGFDKIADKKKGRSKIRLVLWTLYYQKKGEKGNKFGSREDMRVTWHEYSKVMPNKSRTKTGEYTLVDSPASIKDL